MRSIAEIAFRLKQEARNLWWYLVPPRWAREGVNGTGTDIDWRMDYVNGKTTPLRYFRLIPYLDFARAGDHKVVWDLNRHQQLVALATGEERHAQEIVAQLNSWMDQNPFLRGINWTSALEVGIRAVSWLQIFHAVGDRFPVAFRERFLRELYRHGRYLENNLSIYFSPYNHLLGEAVALHAMGKMFPGLGREAGALVESLMRKQVHGDGSYFEQSTYYHGYALGMFRFHASLIEPSQEYLATLARMQEYLDAVPLFGDDDGGRFSILEPRPRVTRMASRLFPDAGTAVMCAGPVYIAIDAGPFGTGSAGHSHSDTLSLVVGVGDEEILIDPGTFTYTMDGGWRDRFRGTSYHSTIRIDGLEQADAAGPFRWNNPPVVRVLEWASDATRDSLVAECSHHGFTHRRGFEFDKPGRLTIHDHLDGPPGEHIIEQFWQLGSKEVRARFTFDAEPEWIEGWRSKIFGGKSPSPVLRLVKRTSLPCTFTTELRLT